MATVKKTTTKEPRILLIIESPKKAVTVRGFMPKNYVVEGCVGHITKLADVGYKNVGVDVQNHFKPTFVVPDDKKDIVRKLKEQAKFADQVIIMTDPDREGEAIAWHIAQQLKLPKSKYKRATVHEINKPAFDKALSNLRDINMNLVAAAIARQIIDKMIGYMGSDWIRHQLKLISMGRCQTPAVGLIVELEEAIETFVPETWFDLYVKFKKNKTDFKAKYVGTEDKEIDGFVEKADCDAVKTECEKGEFKILSITKKDAKENPKPPFITSTLLAEAERKLNLDTATATAYSNDLFSGINMGGKHVALITYIRTDDPNFAPEFLPVLKDYVVNTYGADYQEAPKKYKAPENAQEGHECIRCVDPSITPEIVAQYITNSKIVKLYELIWKRTIAAGMKPAVFAVTNYLINNGKHLFTMTSKELKFDGYRKVYAYGDDDNSEIIKETFKKDEVLKNTSLEVVEKQSTPPTRMDEAKLIATLEKIGIGRPATYAPTVKTALDPKRQYCKKEGKYIVPLPNGRKLWHACKEKFKDVVSVEVTAYMETQLDLIAQGKKSQEEVLQEFYDKLIESIKNASGSLGESLAAETKGDKICPKCGSVMKVRKGPYGVFWGCGNYPNCRYLEKIKKKEGE